MDPALVSCSSCSRTWHSRTMAEGLRAIGSCPRCGGELVWAEGDTPVQQPDAAVGVDRAPHLVLGRPRLG